MDGPTFHLSKGDAVTWLRALPSESIDLVVTDPPYESLEKHRAIGTTTRLKHSKASSNEWFSIFPNTRFPELFAEVYRVLRRNTHFYLYCDPETMFVAKPLAEEAGFKFWKPIVWDKKSIGMGYHYRARYECILFFEKGKRKLNNLGIADILEA
ncbi:MAG: DNA methyltransferase, partial [Kofleriaceae bacterium]